MNIPRITGFDRIVFFTGAGMSAASGVPTYRGAGGIWKTYDHRSYACQEAFDADPAHVWEFHNYRRGIVAACAPNRGHELIARAEALFGDRVTVVTQNIDGLHQLAGSTRVHELHGSLWRVRCDSCGATHHGRENPLAELHCAACGGWWRPDIVWFGDSLRSSVIRESTAAIKTCNLLISIGTSAVVYPAAELPLLARKAGATLVEVNPEETMLSEYYDINLRTTAVEALEALSAGLEG